MALICCRVDAILWHVVFSEANRVVSEMKFEQAVAVWPEGECERWNQMVGFYTKLEAGVSLAESGELRITGADCYRIWCNGRFAGYGPARAAHGHSRVDVWPLAGLLEDGVNHLAIEVSSCGIDSYAYAMQPPFLLAEVVCGGEVVAATGRSFSACLLTERVQKVERFSKQRPFAEAYRLSPESNDWRMGEGSREAVACVEVTAPTLLPRHVRLPGTDCVEPRGVLGFGSAVAAQEPLPSIKHIRRNGVGVRVMGYPIDELEIDMSDELNRLSFVDAAPDAGLPGVAESQHVAARGTCNYDFGIIQGGFIGTRLRCERATRVYLIFDEVRERPPEKVFTLGVGAVALDLEPGEYSFETLEPYSFRYLRVLSLQAPVEVDALWVREYVNPVAELQSPSDDPELAAIFQAGRQTFRTNSVDLFTDCMSRERGGYPCDSWFTARAELLLTGESLVERNFLENYFLVDTFASIPAGMMPHCYPSDRLGKGQYIPNWALWLVMQLCAYCKRTDDAALRELALPRVEALFDWFAPYRNDQGLLEDLPGWIFVEWSPANDCTEAVNHPTNMLYAHCLSVAAEVYDRPAWGELAEETRTAVRAESWDGRWFADQSIRVDGTLQRGAVCTETCQYHALYFGIATPAEYPELWERLRDNWGPLRGMHMAMVAGGNSWNRYYDEGVVPQDDDMELAPAGLLYGLMLRFDLLQQQGEWERLLKEVRRVFGPMAAESGTLWEHMESHASLNHGFASCACEYLQRALAHV
jgi:alpha-L-rhamnosidase